jgi:hypothetical protein
VELTLFHSPLIPWFGVTERTDGIRRNADRLMTLRFVRTNWPGTVLVQMALTNGHSIGRLEYGRVIRVSRPSTGMEDNTNQQRNT